MTSQPPTTIEIEQKLKNALNNPAESQQDIKDALAWVSDIVKAERRPKGAVSYRDWLRDDFKSMLHAQGITSGKICEIGGPNNSFAADMPDYQFEYISLYPDAKFPSVMVADATQCDHMPDNSYDAIFSVSVFEHISKPWKAAANLTRLLKPGGVMYHSAPFSYFYHGAPADFWRYTPDALQLLFSELRPLKAEFFGRNRRRDNRGSASNQVDKDGGPAFALDSLGGWRENWSSVYAGVKDAAYLTGQLEAARRQIVINLMKGLTKEGGKSAEDAAALLVERLPRFHTNADTELLPLRGNEVSNLGVDTDYIMGLWNKRGVKNGLGASYSRFVMMKIFER